MNTIKGRILAAFVILFVLVSPLAFYVSNSIIAINNSKNLREKVAIFNATQLNALNSFTKIWNFDTQNEAFYINYHSPNSYRFNHEITQCKITLNQLTKLLKPEQTVLLKLVQQLNTDLNTLENEINILLALQQQRGFKNFGLEGAMRQYAHKLEKTENTVEVVELLSLRRREKDFFLRGDTSYVSKFNEECDLIKARLATNVNANNDALAFLDHYQNKFNAIVKLENKIGNQYHGSFSKITLLSTNLDNIAKRLYALSSNQAKGLIQHVKTYLVIIFSFTLLFVMAFGFIFSNYINKPIHALIQDMKAITAKGFKGNPTLKDSYSLKETKTLTNSYNQLIITIKDQLKTLDQKNKELSQINDKLTQSEKELKEASKLKDKFFSIISHDLRNHTGNVLSLAQVLNTPGAISDKEKTVFTKYLMDSSQNLQLLLDNLLNWAKTQMNDHEMSKKSFDVSTLISKNIALFNENALRKGVKIMYQHNLLAKAYADKDMIDFVIRNLLSNALKFTTRGDTIAFAINEYNNSLEVLVTDTGVGMTAQQVQTLSTTKGESFTTTGTSNEQGSGLGLSICKDFIVRNGGKLFITSQKGKGATFSFTIPTTLTKESILVSPPPLT